jgi:multiple sugar transport system permease protein
MVALLLRIIDVFNKLFDVVYIMTGGGPGRDTEILTVLAYRSSFQYFFMHHGAIVALFLLIIIIIICKYLISIMKAKEMQQ